MQNKAVRQLIETHYEMYYDVEVRVYFLHSIDDIETFHCKVSFNDSPEHINRDYHEFDIDIKKYNLSTT